MSHASPPWKKLTFFFFVLFFHSRSKLDFFKSRNEMRNHSIFRWHFFFTLKKKGKVLEEGDGRLVMICWVSFLKGILQWSMGSPPRYPYTIGANLFQMPEEIRRRIWFQSSKWTEKGEKQLNFLSTISMWCSSLVWVVGQEYTIISTKMARKKELKEEPCQLLAFWSLDSNGLYPFSLVLRPESERRSTIWIEPVRIGWLDNHQMTQLRMWMQNWPMNHTMPMLCYVLSWTYRRTQTPASPT